MIGIMILTGTELFLMSTNPNSRQKERNGFALIAAARNDVLTKQFEDIIRFRRVLEGSFLPLLALVVGILFEFHILPSLDSALAKVEESAKGSLRTNLSLSIKCDRKPLGDDRDELCIKATLSKGDRGTIALHDAQAQVSYLSGQERVSFTDNARLSFDPPNSDPQKRKSINWARPSRTKELINLAPSEVTEMACHCRVPHKETCKVEVVVLGFHFSATDQTEGTMGQWRASCVSLFLTNSETGTRSSENTAELPS